MEGEDSDAADGGENGGMPELSDDSILIKTLCAGLERQKATDDHGLKLRSTSICGRVLSIGSKVSADCPAKPGDVVILYPWLGCGQCETCSSGSAYLCEDFEEYADRNSFELSAYVVVQDWQNLIKLPREIPKDIGCMLPHWALRVYAAVQDAKPAFEQAVLIRGFANLLVIGRANLELWCIAFLKNVFCDRNVKVICAERSQDSLDLASRSGADDAVLWKDGASVEDLVDATTMSGYNKMDVVIDFVGDEDSFSVAFLSLHNGGTIVELGAGTHEVNLPLSTVRKKSATVRAVRAGSRNTLKQLVDLIAIQRVQLSIPVESFCVDAVSLALKRLDNDEVKGQAIVKYE